VDSQQLRLCVTISASTGAVIAPHRHGRASPHRHGRAWPGHPRLSLLLAARTWMDGVAKPRHDDGTRTVPGCDSFIPRRTLRAKSGQRDGSRRTANGTATGPHPPTGFSPALSTARWTARYPIKTRGHCDFTASRGRITFCGPALSSPGQKKASLGTEVPSKSGGKETCRVLVPFLGDTST
jgi:hypothetical protein